MLNCKELLTEARTLLDALGGSDPGLEAAVDSGQADEWKRLRALRGELAQLRTDQGRVFRLDHGTNRRFRETLLVFIRNPIEADPEYVARRLGWRVPTPSGGERDPKPPPWPPELWSEAGLDWLALHPDSKPWVPTRGQLEQRGIRVRTCLPAASAGPARGAARSTGVKPMSEESVHGGTNRLAWAKGLEVTGKRRKVTRARQRGGGPITSACLISAPWRVSAQMIRMSSAIMMADQIG
jgi:hypothetical protein